MSILDSIKDKAKELIDIAAPFSVRETQTYNAAKNSVIVAGIPLVGVVSSTVSSDVITRQETGIDYYYTTYYHSIEQRTLTVTLLPTSSSLSVLRELALKQQTSRGWFNLSVHENHNIVNVYRAWIISLPEISMQHEGSDREVVFGIKTMYAGVGVINQPTNYEQENFSKYGVAPDKTGSNQITTINESTGNPSRNTAPVVRDLTDNYEDGSVPITPIVDSDN